MKKSEILEILNGESANNVSSYYKLEKTNLLIVYCGEISWYSIKKIGDKIIDITAGEKNDDKIRISFDEVIFD